MTSEFKKLLVSLTAMFLVAVNLSGQLDFKNESSKEYPFGKPHAEAPSEILNYSSLIGLSECTSTTRNPDQTWSDPVSMTWKFKYIMNGMAVQDETLKSDGLHSGSIRQYIADSSKWYVHYYSSGTPTVTLPVWEGQQTSENEMILYREQKAPNGMDGFYKLKFYDMSEKGFNWEGAWVNNTETFSFPTWRIECRKIQ